MKKNVWLISAIAALSAAVALAQDSGPAAPAQKKKPTAIKTRVEMNPPGTALVKGDAVNVRGQPSFAGEVLGHLQKGDTVTVLEQITLNHPPSGEPPEWYKIVMPTNIPAWVDAQFIDADSKSVKVRRVNLRGGPGENYSVVGRLEKGAAVNQIRSQGGWLAIEAPTNAYAFVAAELLEIQAVPVPEVVAVTTPAAPVPAAPAPATNEPAAAAPVAPAPTAQTEAEQELAALRQATPTETPAAAPAPAPAPVAAEPTGPRIVTRDGFVHRSYNIQSPADYELHDIRTGALTEYLQPQNSKDFKIYVGTRVTVTGPEVIDQRWPRTPVLQVQTVDLMP